MIYVLISGALGYFVFDCYRVRATYLQKNVVFVTFSNFLGVGVHLAVYCAAGILALFVSLDSIDRCCGWQWLPHLNNELVGPLLRGFGVGLAGPAGLSKGKAATSSRPRSHGGKALDDLAAPSSAFGRVSKYFDVLLMRQ